MHTCPTMQNYTPAAKQDLRGSCCSAHQLKAEHIRTRCLAGRSCARANPWAAAAADADAFWSYGHSRLRSFVSSWAAFRRRRRRLSHSPQFSRFVCGFARTSSSDVCVDVAVCRYLCSLLFTFFFNYVVILFFCECE